MSKPLKIGTRGSKLAMHQAKIAETAIIASARINTTIVPIASMGDVDLQTPLHAFSNTGIFTSALDDALLENEIDIAIHSLKDLPTTLNENLTIAAVLPRDDHRDVCLQKNPENWKTPQKLTIATGSQRRKAMWQFRFPNHHIVELRGNINTRLEKLENNAWDGAFFSAAALKRLKIKLGHHIFPDFFTSAPGQGVLAIVIKKNDEKLYHSLKKINHLNTQICTTAERTFLKLMEGGCIAPIGAYAKIVGNQLTLDVHIADVTAKNQVKFNKSLPLNDAAPTKIAHICHKLAIEQGGEELVKAARKK